MIRCVINASVEIPNNVLRRVHLERRLLSMRASTDRASSFLDDKAHVVNGLKRDQIIRGVPVARLDENGLGVVELFVRRDKQLFEFTFERAIPGEKLHLRVGEAKRDRYNKKKPGRYRLLIEERGAASVDEVTPMCQHFVEKCGGCSFQHMAYHTQLQEKNKLLAHRLRQYDLAVGELRPTVPSPSAFGFHSRTEFRFFLRDGLQLGMHPAKNPIPIAVKRCELHPDASQLAFDATLKAARAEPRAIAFDQRTGRGWLCSAIFRAALDSEHHAVQITLVTLPTISDSEVEVLRQLAGQIHRLCPQVTSVMWSNSGGEPAERTAGWRSRAADPQTVLFGSSVLNHYINGSHIEAIPEASLRPNLLLLDALCQTVLDLSGARPEDVVWDTFSGQGPLAQLLSRQCSQLIAFDRSEPALDALRRSLEATETLAKTQCVRIDLGSPAELRSLAARLPENEFAYSKNDSIDDHLSDDELDTVDGDDSPEEPVDARKDLEKSLTSSVGRLSSPDVLVADPGRNGLPKAFRRFLYNIRVRTIVLIGSGRPLLRDCVLLSRRGYEVRVLAPFDSYPHTARLDTVAQLCWVGLDGSHRSTRDSDEPF